MLLALLSCFLLASCSVARYSVAWLQVLVNNRMRQQQVYFNHVVTGCPALRTFDVHNVWDRPLLFEIGADTAEIQVQTEWARDVTAPPPVVPYRAPYRSPTTQRLLSS